MAEVLYGIIRNQASILKINSADWDKISKELLDTLFSEEYDNTKRDINNLRNKILKFLIDNNIFGENTNHSPTNLGIGIKRIELCWFISGIVLGSKARLYKL